MTFTFPGIHTKPEILSQPVVCEKTLEHLKTLDASLYPNITKYDQVIFTACGSTYYLFNRRWAYMSKTLESFQRSAKVWILRIPIT